MTRRAGTTKDTPAKRRDILAFLCGLAVKQRDLRELVRAGLLVPWRCARCGHPEGVPFTTCPLCVPAAIIIVDASAPRPTATIVDAGAAMAPPRILPPGMTIEGHCLAYRTLAEAPQHVCAAVRAVALEELRRLQAEVVKAAAPPRPLQLREG